MRIVLAMVDFVVMVSLTIVALDIVRQYGWISIPFTLLGAFILLLPYEISMSLLRKKYRV